MDEEDDLIFHAIQRSTETGANVIDTDKCIGCRMCMVGCPFGAMRYDPVKKQSFKCQLCDGDPQCVKFCPTEALKFLPKDMANLPKLDRLARKIVEQKPIVPAAVTVEASNVHS
jgi:Fe-S-cluster-containing dehydrogenase component